MTKTTDPWWARAACWLALTASFVLSAKTWVSMARLGGFDDWTAWAMPAAVDSIVIAGLGLWLCSSTPDLVRFAKWVTYVFAVLGVLSQSAFHLSTSGWIGALVGALPPAVGAVSVHVQALMSRARQVDNAQVTGPVSTGHTPRPSMSAPEVDIVQEAEDILLSTQADTPVEAPVSAPPAPVRPIGSGLSTSVREAAVRLRQEDPDRTQADIARSLGVSTKTVQRALKEAVNA